MLKKLPAVLGGREEFQDLIPVGQLYFPSFNDYKNKMENIFNRQYYTNHGPLVKQLENLLADYLKVKNVICTTNGTIATMIGIEALELTGPIIVPSFTFAATPLSVKRCKTEIIFCDIASDSCHIDAQELSKVYSSSVSAVLGVNLWGGAAPIQQISEWAKEKSLKVLWDSCQGMGTFYGDKPLGCNGDLEVFSMHATKILSCTEGGCIATNDNNLAEKARNIRSSYGSRRKISVNRTLNGRMSEFQAAIGLLSLENIESRIQNNYELVMHYIHYLHQIPGIEILSPENTSRSNFQNLIIAVHPGLFGLNAKVLCWALHFENILARRYFIPLPHQQEQFGIYSPLPNTESFQKKILTLPLGAKTNIETISRICDCINNIHLHSREILRKYSAASYK